MLRISVLSLTLTLGAFAVADETRSITDAESVIAIYTEDWRLAAPYGPQLILGVWGDGLMIWSDNTLRGGPPYYSAQLNPQHVGTALKRLTDRGIFKVPDLRQGRVGVDSQFTTILIRDGKNELKMQSWHELVESNDGAIAASYGATGLKDQTLMEALAGQPAEYLHYRMTWLELRLAVSHLIPKTGKQANGAPIMSRGKLSWKFTGSD